MTTQTGGAATPRQWIVIALLFAALASAGMNIYQMRHKRIEIGCVHLQLAPSTSRATEI